MDFDNSRPIWIQLLEELKRLIANGTWRPGDRIPAVRELASTYQVNPNTAQRALTELERIGLGASQRTVGRFVTDSTTLIDNLKKELAYQAITECVDQLKGLNITLDTASELLNRTWGKENHDTTSD